MVDYPLVTVICTNFNQGRFLKPCIESAVNQTYPNVEIILCDDASTDESLSIITQLVSIYPTIIYIQNEENLGLCKTFNKALAQAKGSFIIDLAADDLLEPDRIEIGILYFEQKYPDASVQYSKYKAIDENGNIIPHLSPKYEGLAGNIYEKVIKHYFINAATVMSRKIVYDKLKGYDSRLSYEDFDFWIRSSRIFDYCFIDKALVRKRKVDGSLSSQQYQLRNIHTKSTYLVCRKIFNLNKHKKEHQALIIRCLLEVKNSLSVLNFYYCFKFLLLAMHTSYFLLSSPRSMLR